MCVSVVLKKSASSLMPFLLPTTNPFRCSDQARCAGCLAPNQTTSCSSRAGYLDLVWESSLLGSRPFMLWKMPFLKFGLVARFAPLLGLPGFKKVRFGRYILQSRLPAVRSDFDLKC